jgi:hypothetical protein
MDGLKTDAAPKTQNCGLATWSLICGILSFLCLPTIPAVILGIIALVKINAGHGLLVGKGKAIAGIVLACLWVVLIPFAVIVAIAIPSFTANRQAARETSGGLLKTIDSERKDKAKSINEMSDLLSPESSIQDIMSNRTSGNEISAVSSLRTIAKAEALWLQQDADGNGIIDYWTYDVSGLYRMLRADGLTKCEFIPLDLANADASSADADIFGDDKLSQRLSAKVVSKYGYLFEAITEDEDGQPYNQEMVNEIPAANKTKFAFVAYPETYGKTGSKTFIINENSTVYEVDPGSSQNKMILQWPGSNPAEIEGPAGSKWTIVDD